MDICLKKGELFDHLKDRFFLLPNFLGNKISSYQGIYRYLNFYLQVIAIFILYKIARMSCKISNFIYYQIFFLVSLYFIYFDGEI